MTVVQAGGANSTEGVEEAMFFPGVAGDLFGVVHRPHTSDLGEAMVFCHAFGEEKLWAHRVFVSYARILASRGYTVLRFDFRGHGDSDGEFSTSSVESREEDLGSALRHLAQVAPDMRRTGLLGLRLGASVALRVAARMHGLGPVILWDPIVDGAGYVQELLRSTLTTQMAIYGKVQTTREDMLASLEQGNVLNVDGYELGKTLVDSLSALDVRVAASTLQAPCLLVQIGRAPKRRLEELQALACDFARVKYSTVAEEPFWREIKRFYERAPLLFEETDQWLRAEHD